MIKKEKKLVYINRNSSKHRMSQTRESLRGHSALLMRLIGHRLSSVSLATLFKLVGCVVYTDIVCHNTTQSCSVARTELSFVRSTWCETFHVCTALSGHCHQLKTLKESSH